jgi:hypothetical protein
MAKFDKITNTSNSNVNKYIITDPSPQTFESSNNKDRHQLCQHDTGTPLHLFNNIIFFHNIT